MNSENRQDRCDNEQAVASMQNYDRERMLFALGAVEGGMDAAHVRLPSKVYAALVETIYELLDGAPMVKVKADSRSSLTQANGWGSAGECLASFSAKTPAAGARCYRVAGVAMVGDTISLCVSLQRPGGGVG